MTIEAKKRGRLSPEEMAERGEASITWRTTSQIMFATEQLSKRWGNLPLIHVLNRLVMDEVERWAKKPDHMQIPLNLRPNAHRQVDMFSEQPVPPPSPTTASAKPVPAAVMGMHREHKKNHALEATETQENKADALVTTAESASDKPAKEAETKPQALVTGPSVAEMKACLSDARAAGAWLGETRARDGEIKPSSVPADRVPRPEDFETLKKSDVVASLDPAQLAAVMGEFTAGYATGGAALEQKPKSDTSMMTLTQELCDGLIVALVMAGESRALKRIRGSSFDVAGTGVVLPNGDDWKSFAAIIEAAAGVDISRVSKEQMKKFHAAFEGAYKTTIEDERATHKGAGKGDASSAAATPSAPTKKRGRPRKDEPPRPGPKRVRPKKEKPPNFGSDPDHPIYSSGKPRRKPPTKRDPTVPNPAIVAALEKHEAAAPMGSSVIQTANALGVPIRAKRATS